MKHVAFIVVNISSNTNAIRLTRSGKVFIDEDEFAIGPFTTIESAESVQDTLIALDNPPSMSELRRINFLIGTRSKTEESE